MQERMKKIDQKLFITTMMQMCVEFIKHVKAKYMTIISQRSGSAK